MDRGAVTDGGAFAEVKALVIARTGHQYYADKDDQLRERVDHRIAERGDAGMAAYRDRIADPDADEWPLLESAVTINETFFFRFAEQFDALRRVILPDLISRRRTGRRLRIWSVGCSTGAEPHSVAILLRDMLGPALADWHVALTGTDIDAAALEVAVRADYSSWALRTVGEEERSRLFDRTADRYRLKARYRGIARFERHNLLSLLDPAAGLQFGEQDLILCRNVLIYFSHADATAIVDALVRRLAPDGILLLGHAEPNPGFDAVTRTVEVGGILAYRRPDVAPNTDGLRPPPASTAPVAPVAAPPRPYRMRPVAASAPPPATTTRSTSDRHDPASHLLAAMDALGRDDRSAAEAGFRRALFLDPGFAMAHYLLARYLAAGGRMADARRSFANALRIAAALPDGVALAGGDGMTAGAMVAATRAALEERA